MSWLLQVGCIRANGAGAWYGFAVVVIGATFTVSENVP
jgi:hypothetical protein